jgi:hypothetical protein
VTDRNQPKDDMNNLDRSALDRELDAALAKFAAVGPRAGLEERVLANLRAERERAVVRAWWRWPVVAAVAAVIVVAMSLAWRVYKPAPNVSTQHAPAPVQTDEHVGTQLARNDGSGSIRPHGADSRRRPKPHAISDPAIVAPAPKLDQFPSPQPLSEQERILAGYVTRFPEHAALVALARTEELRRDRVEEIGEAAPASNQDSQQQNK